MGILRRKTLTIYVIPGDRKPQWPKTAKCLAWLTLNLGAPMALKGKWLVEDSSHTPVPLFPSGFSFGFFLPLGCQFLAVPRAVQRASHFSQGHPVHPALGPALAPAGRSAPCEAGVGMDAIISQFPPSSENLSLWAALTSDSHPHTQGLFSRSSFPPKWELFLLQPPDL